MSPFPCIQQRGSSARGQSHVECETEGFRGCPGPGMEGEINRTDLPDRQPSFHRSIYRERRPSSRVISSFGLDAKVLSLINSKSRAENSLGSETEWTTVGDLGVLIIVAGTQRCLTCHALSKTSDGETELTRPDFRGHVSTKPRPLKAQLIRCCL